MTKFLTRPRGATAAASVIAAALTASLAAAVPSANATPDAEGGAVTEAHSGTERQLVTLITGDRVVLDGSGEVTGLIRGEGREDVPIQVFEDGDATFAIPIDARPLITDGTLDRRLFDVTELSREEYDAADQLPIIVTYDDQARANDTRADLFTDTPAGERPEVTADLSAINGEALTVDANAAAATWAALTADGGDQPLAAAPGIAGIALDGIAEATLDESVPQIGAPTAWDAGYNGEGVTIAVLDTGITTQHDDVSSKVVAAENFTDAPDTDDHYGHGTHVASIAAGTGAHSDGTYTGVAPGAQLLNGKVLDDQGTGYESGIIQGMQWAVDQGADIVNMSLGGSADTTIDPLEEAVNTLSAESDALFVIAAGNSGIWGASTVGSPGTADAALTVGAVDKSDQLAGFSSVGPRLRDGAVKPDITAPGVAIGAAAAPGSVLADEGTPVADGYVALDGTSMATPHTAGAAALLAQQHPDWDGERIKAALTASAQPGDHTVYEQGSGRVDVAAALDQTVVANENALNFGIAEYPHHDDEPITRELTYTNLGTEDVTLDLTAAGIDPNGEPAPEGMFTLGADQVTVPAGGTASVEVTADTSVPGLNGAYGVMVTATGAGDGQTVRAPGGVLREAETHELTLEATDRNGEPATDWLAAALNLETFDVIELPTTGDPVRLPAGEWLIDTNFPVSSDASGEVTGLDWLTLPSLALTEDTTLALDAREAVPAEVTLSGAEAQRSDLAMEFGLGTLDDTWDYASSWSLGSAPDGLRTLQLGEAPEGFTLSSSVNATFRGSDDREYHALDELEGAFYSGLDKTVTPADMARIDVGLGASLPDRTGYLFVDNVFDTATAVPAALPRTAEVYVEGGSRPWEFELFQTNPEGDNEAWYSSLPVTYTAGEQYQETLNVGVFGPMFGTDTDGGAVGGLRRWGDKIVADLYEFADGAGHVGDSRWASSTATLYRNGEEYATLEDVEWVAIDVPDDEANYELVVTINREGVAAAVSTEFTASYTFTSVFASEHYSVPLPGSAIRFTPELALDSTSPAGETVTVPVTVQPSAEENVEALTVSVSTDGGETWTETPVEDGAVTVDNPAAGGSVSFRAETEDSQGNTTTQTIIDAYRTA
ncbi:S8 family serine peptidase [Streptomyces sp. B6B3]|uniref:S8 family serine peptidase n=1 Tax=Streptomyces sp. B6B3 TaxID=3153570 RepID=UPI00325E436E